MLICIYLVTFVALASAAFDIETSIEPKSGDSNTIFKLEVSINLHGLEKVGEPLISTNSDFIIESRGKKQSMSIVNGDPSQSISYIYQVLPKKQLAPGEYLLPQGSIVVDGQSYSLEQQRIKIETAPKITRRGPLDFAQVVDNLAPFEGEQLTYRSELVSSAEIADAVLEETTLPSFFREDFPEHKQVVRRVSNSRVFSVREAIYPNKVGEVEIPERGLSAKVKVQNDSKQKWGEFFDDLWTDVFDEFNFKPIRITAPALKLKVRPLPEKPSGVIGYTPVGTTTIKSKIDKAELRAGESVVLEILVESEGNLKPLEFDFAKILPKHIRFYPEKAESENILNGERVIQRKHFQAALIPEYGGQFELLPPTISYFDPRSEKYQQAHAEKLVLIVSGAAPSKITEPVIESLSDVEHLPEELPESKDIYLPSQALLSIGMSRRWFSIFFAVILLSVLVNVWSKAPRNNSPVKRTFKEIIEQLRKNDWEMPGPIRSELIAASPSNADKVISLIERVIFSTPSLRAESIEKLESYLRELK